MIKEGLDYIQRHDIDMFEVDLVGDRVVARIDDYWDNVLRYEDKGSAANPMPAKSLAEDIKKVPLTSAENVSSTSSEGKLVIDESRNSDHDIFDDE